MTPRSARTKGKKGEREIADWLEGITGARWRRVPMSGALHLDFPYDVMKLSKDIPTIFDGVGIEVKNTAGLRIPEWIVQCDEAELDFRGFLSGGWVLFFRHKTKWFATMPLAQLEKFISKT